MELDNIQHLEQLVKKNKVAPVYSFLKDLSHKERRALVPQIKKLDSYYGKFIQKGITWSYRGTGEQLDILRIAGFVCLTGTEYAKWGSNFLDKEQVLKIFEFYIPEWFGKFINERANKDGFAPFRMDYEWMMQLKEQKILEPSNELITSLLPQFLYDTEQIKGSHFVNHIRNDNKLLQFPDTLDEHIWLFFKEESNIHWSDRETNHNDPNKKLLSWKQSFKYFADQGTIDRHRLLQESLSVANMNFNKLAVGWFIDLFEYLEPTTTEMLTLQEAMLAVVNCPHSKPVNVILKYFKKLCLDQAFLTDEFLSYMPILLTKETKSIVTSTLMILDKLARKNPGKGNEISTLAAQALVNAESSVQLRTAKLIAKYGDPKNDDLSNEIEAFEDVLLTDPRTTLAPFLSEKESIEENNQEAFQSNIELDKLTDENEVKIPDTIDDLMFLASEAFDNHDPLHVDVLPAALVNMHGQLTEDNVSRFEPALQRAYKLVMGDWRAGVGLLDHLLASFFIEYCGILMNQFKVSPLEKVRETYLKKEKENSKSRYYQRRLFPFTQWYDASDSPIFKPFFNKLAFIIKAIKSANFLPVLSTPTHYPFWIDPKILVDRIKKWQEEGQTIGHADLQLAISRTYLKNAKDNLEQVDRELVDEPKRLLQFLFDKDTKPKGPFKTIAHWWTASITKNPEIIYYAFSNFKYTKEARANYTGDYKWSVGIVPFTNTRWDYEKRRTVNFTDYRKKLEIKLYPKKGDQKLFGDLFTIYKSPKIGQSLMIYEQLHFKGEWYETNDNDVKRCYGIVPNNPEKLFAKIADKTLKYPEFPGETSKKMFINTLECLLIHNQPMGNMAHLLIAGGMISSDKTARSLAGEVWLYCVTHGFINSEKIGKIIGQHFAVEFAPLKRFTDLIIDNLLNVTSLYNLELQILLEQILIEMSDESVRGLKKLLELYNEVTFRNSSKISTHLDRNLKAWTNTKSLVPVINKLLSKV